MSKVQIKFQGDAPESKPVKFYIGTFSQWPVGVYRNSQFPESIVAVLDGYVLYFDTSNDGFWDGDTAAGCTTPFIRISDNPRIASITFAGSMNYPDGKPEGGASS